MNVERLREMADVLDPLPYVFDAPARKPDEERCVLDMSVWLRQDAECGTVACMAGHTVLRYDGLARALEVVERGDTAGRAAELLGLCETMYDYYLCDGEGTAEKLRRARVARALFFPPSDVGWDGKDAAKVLRAVAASPDTITHAELVRMWGEIEAEGYE